MGTPNITGQYKGTYNIVIRASEDTDQFGKVQAFSGTADDPLGATTWTWDFDNKVVVLEYGRLTPSPTALPLPVPVEYFDYELYADSSKESNVLSINDDGDGYYIVDYYWKVIPNITLPIGAPEEATHIKLEITQLKDGSIAVVTAVDPETSWVPGTPLENFPRKATPDWRGRATKE